MSCTVTRREISLGQVLEECLIDYLQDSWEDYGEESAKAMELLGMAAIRKEMNIFLEPAYKTWFMNDWVRLDDVFMESLHLDRVLYEAFPVTIPAGDSVMVTAVMKKEPSYDYYGAGSWSVGVTGYDMVTQLGTGLEFTDVTARLQNVEKLDILSQKCGFDLQQGITEVKLDVAEEHYQIIFSEKE